MTVTVTAIIYCLHINALHLSALVFVSALGPRGCNFCCSCSRILISSSTESEFKCSDVAVLLL